MGHGPWLVCVAVCRMVAWCNLSLVVAKPTSVVHRFCTVPIDGCSIDLNCYSDVWYAYACVISKHISYLKIIKLHIVLSHISISLTKIFIIEMSDISNWAIQDLE